MKLWMVFILFLIILSFACSEGEITGNANNYLGEDITWAVDTNKMTGTGLTHAFPIIENPIYSNTIDISAVNSSDEKAIVFKLDDVIFIYPLNMMGVEVVNDISSQIHFAVTYCPKTETSYVINRKINQKIHTFKASGILYQDNLVYYDLESGSFWSQMLFKSIHGPKIHQSPDYINSFEIQYNAALDKFPGAKVLTGFADIAGNLKSSAKPGEFDDSDKVIGFLSTNSKPGTLPIVNTNRLSEKGVFIFEKILVVYDCALSFINAFEASPGRTYEFYDNFPNILIDNEGNIWDAFGTAVSGPARGEQMDGTISFLAFGWAWQGIYDTFNHLTAE